MSCNRSHSCGCSQKKTNKKQALFYFLFAILFALLLLSFDFLKEYQSQAMEMQSLGMIWIMGFLTGLHCITMCGGLMVGYVNYSIKHKISLKKAHLIYSITKTLSYASLGALFGAIGGVINFSNGLKSSIALLGGIFLLYISAKSFGLLGSDYTNLLSRYTFLKGKNLEKPHYIGLLNGLMISCAPLQALYMIAAAKGDPFYGALLLAVFSLGTLPIFLFYGVLLNFFKKLKSVWSDRIIASMIVVYALLMIQQGFALSGYHLNLYSKQDNNYALNNQPLKESTTITMDASAKGWSKKVIYFTPTKKIKWEINVTELTYCNKTIEIPSLGIKKELKKGLNIIEFSPHDQTRFVYTCWMGMMTGEFIKE